MNVFSLLIVLMLLFSSAMAAVTPSAGHKDRSSLPITIKSNQLATDNKGKTAVFTGKVVAKQGDITILAEKVSINYGNKGDVERIETEGNVRIIQENRTGIADRATYDSREGRITLTGHPKVMQGSDTLTGETITYYVDEDRSVVTGGANTRVEAVIQPPPKKSNAAPR